MAIKISEKLNIVSSTLTLILVIFIISKNLNTQCFNWIDYSVGFGTLFINIMISILSASGL